MIKKVLIVLVIVMAIGIIGNMESTYTRQATVTNSKDNVVTVEDNCGCIWAYKGSATVGDTVTLVMHDSHTSKITDDIVKGVK